jgi:hypothetical protein
MTNVTFPQNPAPPDDENEQEEQEEGQPDPDAAARILHNQPARPRKKARSGQSVGDIAARAGVGRPPGHPHARVEWQAKEADFLWPEMMQELKSRSLAGLPGCTPHDITIRCVAMALPGQQTLSGELNGGAVTGDYDGASPGEMLITAVDEFWHMPRAHGPAQYDLVFCWKADGTVWGRGRLFRPDPAEIVAMQRAKQNHQRARPPAPGGYNGYTPGGMGAPPPQGGPPQGHGYPHQQPGGYPAQMGYPPNVYPPQGQGFGAPPGYPYYPPPQQGPTYAEAELRSSFAQLQGQLAAVLDFVKQQGVQVPVGLAAPPLPPPPVAAPPQQPVYMQPPPQRSFETELSQAVGVLERLRGTYERLDGFFGNRNAEGLGAPEPEPVAVTPPQPGDSLSFNVVPIPETSFKYALDKKTGDVDWGQTAFVNAESEVGKKLIGIVGDFVQNLGKMGGVRPNGNVLPEAPMQHAQNGHANGVGKPSGWNPT